MKILRIPFVAILLVLAVRELNVSAQTETNLHSFAGYPSADGNNPHYAGLVQGSDSNFYGTTSSGGANCPDIGCGTVFRISPSGTYTTLYSFAGSPDDGADPEGGLVQGTDGYFYGTTEEGGTNGCNCGTVFRISPSGSYTNLYSFGNSPPDGVNPFGALVQGSDSNFYGTTRLGGANSAPNGGPGTVFRISSSGSYTSLYSFADYPTDGVNPSGALVQGSDSNFYGTTSSGGANLFYGTVFRISPNGTETTLYSFGSSPGDGTGPESGLVQGSDGNFYGTTFGGGTNLYYGTVFQISPSGSYTNLHSFAGAPNDEKGPSGALVQGSDSNFYGMASGGGTNCNCGTVFRISPSGSYTNLYSFAGSPYDGANPYAGLVRGSDGNFFGTTIAGGSLNFGTVFELDVGLGPISTNCTYSINPTNAVFDVGGGSDSVSVTAPNGCDWSATNNDSFITITSGSSGSGNGTVHYTVAANTNSSEQVGTMTIAGQTFTVTESGTTSTGGCTYTLNATSVTLAAKGGSKNVSVKVKGTDCSWTAVSNDPFITITSGSSGTGKGKVDYTVPGNTNTTALTGTMTIAGETFTVNQAAGGCTFKLSPKAGKIKAAGGSATVKVGPNFSDCDWTAVSNDSFITITSGASGTGKGTVTYTVPANTTTNILTGSMTIAGENYTVIQAGVK